MPVFSKFVTSQRGAQQLLDSDGYIYSQKKCKDTDLTSVWRCTKYGPPTKCKCYCYLSLSDNSLSLGSQSHNHNADKSAPERREVIATLKKKAAEQQLSATQNLISESLAQTSVEANQNFPTVESLAKVVQRSRAAASGSAQHSESATSVDFILPPTCTSTHRGKPFVVFDGSTGRDVRVVTFATRRNLVTLAK